MSHASTRLSYGELSQQTHDLPEHAQDDIERYVAIGCFQRMASALEGIFETLIEINTKLAQERLAGHGTPNQSRISLRKNRRARRKLADTFYKVTSEFTLTAGERLVVKALSKRYARHVQNGFLSGAISVVPEPLEMDVAALCRPNTKRADVFRAVVQRSRGETVPALA